MRTSEVAQICGVTEKTVYNNASKANVVLEHGKSKDWTEDEVKRLQLVLMKNATNAGGQASQDSIVKATVESTFQSGLTLQVIMDSGNLEALEEFVNFARKGTQARHDLLLEQQKNQLLIEQKEALQKEVDKYVNWKSAREIKLEFKLPARPGIEKVAMLLNLKEGEDWIVRFYDEVHPYKKILYSPEAVERIVEYIKEVK